MDILLGMLLGIMMILAMANPKNIILFIGVFVIVILSKIIWNIFRTPNHVWEKRRRKILYEG